MTKQELQGKFETLAEEIAESFGAEVKDEPILVAGKPQTKRVAVGGMFNLDAARGLLWNQIVKHKEAILDVQFGVKKKAPAEAPAETPAS